MMDGEVIIWIVLCIVHLSAYLLEQKRQKDRAQAVEMRLLKQQNRYCMAHYMNSQKQWEKVQKIRHDMKNTYVLELGYLESQQYGLLQKHYENILGDLEYGDALIDTGNIGIDSIVNYKKELAKALGIDFKVYTRIAGEITVRNEDLNIILGNLIDNAMEAVGELEEKDREIRLSVKSDKTALLIHISNKYTGERKKDKQGNYITGKEDKESHGIGLKEIDGIVKRYNGSIEVSDLQEEFHVQVFLYMTDNREITYQK